MKPIFLGHYYLFVLAYFIVITAFAFSVFFVFRRKWVIKSRLRTFSINLTLMVFSTLYLLVTLEGVAAYLFVQSDGFWFTLASKRWFYKYWNPINSYGYRDHEPEWKGKIILVVGDSFVAGHGIKNIDDRFSNILSKKLGKEYTTTTLAQNGWNPQDYYKALKNHEKIPNVIIISYYINDIQSAASRNGINMPKLRKDPNKLIRPLVTYSYLFNWAYWVVYRENLGGSFFWEYLKQAYTDDNVWKTHTQELDALIEYANQVNAKIAFIIWPNLRDVSGSADITSKVTYYLANKDVMVFDLSKYFDKRNSDELIVNPMDAHPNRTANAEVAQLLFESLSIRN